MKQTEKILEYFYAHADLLNKMTIDEIRDIVSLATCVIIEEEYATTLKRKAYEILCHTAMGEILTVEERWTLYWRLQYTIFVTPKFDDYERHLRKIYETIYYAVESQMPDKLLQTDENEAKDGPVIIVTSQFLSEAHAPTRRVLDYAYTIQKKLGIKTVIMNDGGLNLKQFEYMYGAFGYNFAEIFSTIEEIGYKDTTFPFYQAPDKMLDLQKIADMVHRIKTMKPRLVLNVGACCLTSDLCHHFAKNATIACSTSIPTTMGGNLVVCRKLRESDRELLDEMQPWQQCVESVFNYVMPGENEMKHYMRSQFRIPDEAWLIITAGNRMDAEMDEDFFKTVDKILGKLPEAHFMVVGELSDKERMKDKFVYRERVHLPGGLEDGSQAVRLADLYIQPKRKGGGRAAFEALYYGVPAIIPNYGDAWDVCGRAFEVGSYEEMEQKAVMYYFNHKDYEAMKRISRDRAVELEDMEGMMKKLFKGLHL